MAALRIAGRRLPSTISLHSAVVPALSASQSVRFQSTTTTPTESPKSRASSLINALPGNSAISKTGWVTLGTGLTAAAISNEIFVMNPEVIILVTSATFFVYVASMVRKPYAEWADGQIKKISDILNTARQSHTSAVQTRITSVSQLKDVESLTNSLFDLSLETAKLEHQAFVLKQKVSVASEVKGVLDSWVRYEGQMREEEQRELVRSVKEKVEKGLEDKKLQREILVNAVGEVEALVKNKSI